jgi:hypothetical protein
MLMIAQGSTDPSRVAPVRYRTACGGFALDGSAALGRCAANKTRAKNASMHLGAATLNLEQQGYNNYAVGA